MFRFALHGSIEETLDRAAGEYRVTAVGNGPGIANRVESVGALRQGRWAPNRTSSWFDVRGRQSRTDVSYYWGKRSIEFKARAETFFLRRVRMVDDVVHWPADEHVDDVVSAMLNLADRRWPGRDDGTHRTLIVRRHRPSE